MDLFARFLTLTLFLSVVDCVPAKLPNEEAILKAGGKDAQVIIEKARRILWGAEVFATQAVGYTGKSTTSCWALTVIVRHDSKARTFLEKLYADADRPEVKLYAVAGLISLDPTLKPKFAPSNLPSDLCEKSVQAMNGCNVSHERFGTVLLELLEHGASPYLYEKLPSIYETGDVQRFPEK